MPIGIVTADQRRSSLLNGTSVLILGPSGVGKTTLLRGLPPDQTVCLDLEAGMKSVQDWAGPSIPLRTFSDFRDVAVLIGGPDPAADPNAFYSAQHHAFVREQYADSGLEEFLASRSIVFVDSITDLTRQAMAYAKQQPEAHSDRTGKPDTRGAYGLLGREVIQALKHLQQARSKTVIFVGILERHVDDFNVVSWQPQLEGSKTGRELPGIVDQMVTMHLFARDGDGSLTLDERATERRFVCRAGNPFGLPAKDRSGRLDVTEPPDLAALLTKINRPAPPASANPSSRA